MNSDKQPACPSTPDSQTNLPAPAPQADPSSGRQRTGKSLASPKDTRQRINEMIEDGLSYNQIIAQLGEEAQGLTEDNLHRWKLGGYQDHLRQQRIADQCRLRQDRALACLTQGGPLQAFQAAQQLATAQICEVIADPGADILREALAANPLNYFRMLNAFSRLANGGLKCERVLAETAERQAGLQNPPAPRKRGIPPEAAKELEEALNLM